MPVKNTRSLLENRSEVAGSPAERILLLLKRQGLQTAAEIGQQLGISSEAVRQQLSTLANDDLISATVASGRIGRPVHRWQLTAAGHARFPDAHAEVTVQLIQTIRATFGEAALDQMIAARAAATLESYRNRIDPAADLPTQIAQLCAIRTREGYMAEWKAEETGYLLIEHHCPICAAANACQSFCRTELDLFRAILGPGVEIRRVAHVLAEDSRCAYRIMPVE
jgi:predicted ArsR family transcriptional regulator